MKTFHIAHDNRPLGRPGVYLLIHLDSGRVYVGISQNVHKRIRGHTQGVHGSRLNNAIKKYGIDSFLAFPVYYSLNPETRELPYIEADLIRQYGSYGGGGFNIKMADGGVGPYGPEFSQGVSDRNRVYYARPENRERLSKRSRDRWADPAARAKNIAAIKIALATPEAKARNSTPERVAQLTAIGRAAKKCPIAKGNWLAAMRQVMATDNFKKNMSIAMKAMWTEPGRKDARSDKMKKWWSDPDHHATHSIQMVGRVWINDGLVCRRLRPGNPIPEGWTEGRLGQGTTGLIWITDGTQSRRIKPSDHVPEGWWPGSHTKGKLKPRKGT